MIVMNWKDQLYEYENQKKWIFAVEFMQYVIKNNPNDMDAYILMNYVVMNFLRDEDHNGFNVIYFERIMKKNFDLSYVKYSENAEFLFFTAFTISPGEWYVDWDIEDVLKLYRRAYEMEPNNILYEWGDYAFVCENKKEAAYCAYKTLTNNTLMLLLKQKGHLGEDVVESLHSYQHLLVQSEGNS